MVKVTKFKGYLPKQENVGNIICSPYDVLNTQEAKEMAKGNDMSFLQVNKPEITLPSGTNLYDDSVYQRGKDNLELFKKNGWIVPDTEERMYIYCLTMGERKQAGILGAASVDDYLSGHIRRHELTIKKKEEDRTNLSDRQSANLGPVFLTFKNGEAIEKKMSEIMSVSDPYCDVVTEDGIGHALWKCSVEDSNYLENEFSKIACTYIADGHHRAASAYNVGNVFRRDKAIAEGKEITGNEQFNFFMAIHFPDTQLKIYDYNRVVKSLNGLSKEQLLEKISGPCTIEPIEESKQPNPKCKGNYSLYLDKEWYSCTFKDEIIDRTNLVGMLDAQLLTDHVLTPILGIEDVRSLEKIDFIGGIRGLQEIEKRCNEDCQAGFAMYPVSLDELIKIADSDLIMPSKSTWFEPKCRDGLVLRCFD